MPQISKYVRDALKAHLSDSNTGFNARLGVIAPDYGIDPWEVDWSDTSTNFIFGQVDPQAFEESSVFTYPLVTIDTVRSQNTNAIKFHTFSGPVIAVIQVHHSWPDESVIADFASFVDATEDAVIACLNDRDQQVWAPNLAWGGQVAAQRGAIRMGGLGWLQSLTITCQFALNAS